LTATLVLASASPRRLELLGQLGISAEVRSVDIIEQRENTESASDYVCRIAAAKGRAAIQHYALHDRLVLSADTEVVLDDEVFGKPRDRAHAAEMLRRLSGVSHQVLSAVCLFEGEKLLGQQMCRSEVQFCELSDAEIAAYIQTQEPFGKAGSYAIQGRGAAFIAHLSGSYSAVMGLPLFETAALLRATGRL
jgi:septum formation protein